jgi:hypothetical protein
MLDTESVATLETSSPSDELLESRQRNDEQRFGTIRP